MSSFASNVAVCCVNILLVILSLIFNGFVVYRYLKTKSRQPISNTFLFVLALVDLLQNFISQPVFITSVVLKLQKIFVCQLNDASKTLFALFSGFGFFMVAVVLTSERMIAVIFPIWRRVHLRKLHVVSISLGVFVFWSGFVVVMLHVVNNITLFRPITACFIGISLVYALAGYTKIYSVCRKYTKTQRATTKHKVSKSVVSGRFIENHGMQCEVTNEERGTDKDTQSVAACKTHGSPKITGKNFLHSVNF